MKSCMLSFSLELAYILQIRWAQEKRRPMDEVTKIYKSILAIQWENRPDTRRYPFLFVNCIISMKNRRSILKFFYCLRLLFRDRSFGRNWDKSVTSTKGFCPPPLSKSGLKQVCDVNFGYRNRKFENSTKLYVHEFYTRTSKKFQISCDTVHLNLAESFRQVYIWNKLLS